MEDMFRDRYTQIWTQSRDSRFIGLGLTALNNPPARDDVYSLLQQVGTLSLGALACKSPLLNEFEATLCASGFELAHAELLYQFADDFYRGLDLFQRQEFIWLMRLIDRTRPKHHDIHSK
jgi:hypothetical protein